jgi:hypothetical protein
MIAGCSIRSRASDNRIAMEDRNRKAQGNDEEDDDVVVERDHDLDEEDTDLDDQDSEPGDRRRDPLRRP